MSEGGLQATPNAVGVCLNRLQGAQKSEFIGEEKR
jgi:hypothetical protein